MHRPTTQYTALPGPVIVLWHKKINIESELYMILGLWKCQTVIDKTWTSTFISATDLKYVCGTLPTSTLPLQETENKIAYHLSCFILTFVCDRPCVSRTWTNIYNGHLSTELSWGPVFAYQSLFFILLTAYVLGTVITLECSRDKVQVWSVDLMALVTCWPYMHCKPTHS